MSQLPPAGTLVPRVLVSTGNSAVSVDVMLVIVKPRLSHHDQPWMSEFANGVRQWRRTDSFNASSLPVCIVQNPDILEISVCRRGSRRDAKTSIDSHLIGRWVVDRGVTGSSIRARSQ